MEWGSGFGSLLFSAENLLQGEAVTYLPARGPRGPCLRGDPACKGTLGTLPAPPQGQCGWWLELQTHTEHNTSQTASLPACPRAWRPPWAGMLQRQNPPCPNPLPSLFRQAALGQRPEEQPAAKTPAHLLLLPCNSHWDCCLWENTAGNTFSGNPRVTCLLSVAGKSFFAGNQRTSKGN